MTSSGLMNRSGWLDQAQQRLAPTCGRWSSASACAFGRGDAGERRLGDGEEAEDEQQHDDRDEHQRGRRWLNAAMHHGRVLLAERRPAPGRASGGPRAARARAPASRAVSSGSAWSWPSTCRTPCTTSSASSSSRCRRARRLRGGDRRADHHVAEQQRQSPGRAARSGRGRRASADSASPSMRERQHVGRARRGP